MGDLSKLELLLIYNIGLYIVFFILTYAVGQQFFDTKYSGASEGEQLNMEESAWYTMVTQSTVGYGDIYPLDKAGRILAMIHMVLFVFGNIIIAEEDPKPFTKESHLGWGFIGIFVIAILVFMWVIPNKLIDIGNPAKTLENVAKKVSETTSDGMGDLIDTILDSTPLVDGFQGGVAAGEDSLRIKILKSMNAQLQSDPEKLSAFQRKLADKLGCTQGDLSPDSMNCVCKSGYVGGGPMGPNEQFPICMAPAVVSTEAAQATVAATAAAPTATAAAPTATAAAPTATAAATVQPTIAQSTVAPTAEPAAPAVTTVAPTVTTAAPTTVAPTTVAPSTQAPSTTEAPR